MASTLGSGEPFHAAPGDAHAERLLLLPSRRPFFFAFLEGFNRHSRLFPISDLQSLMYDILFLTPMHGGSRLGAAITIGALALLAFFGWRVFYFVSGIKSGAINTADLSFLSDFTFSQRAALSELPEGEWKGLMAGRVQDKETFVRHELPRGEGAVYLVDNGKNMPYRLKLKSPCFSNLNALPYMVDGKNWKLADLIAIVGSIDFVMGEVDR